VPADDEESGRAATPPRVATPTTKQTATTRRTTSGSTPRTTRQNAARTTRSNPVVAETSWLESDQWVNTAAPTEPEVAAPVTASTRVEAAGTAEVATTAATPEAIAADPAPTNAPRRLLAEASPRRTPATRGRPRVRKVTRVVRRVDAWSVFKVALVFWATVYVVLLVAGALMWSVIVSTGTLSNVESFIAKTFAQDSFTIDGGGIFRASWILGILMVIAGTAGTVTMAVFFNLISDLTGGIRVTVLEEEVRRVEPRRDA
jgi:hypothetical protein